MFEKKADILEKMGAEITTREIKQQPDLWKEALQIYKENKEAIAAFFERAEKETKKKIRVIFTGAGTSQYVGDTLVPYLTKKGNTKVFTFESIGTTDIVAAPYDYLLSDEVTILVSFARSGNSPESLAAVEIANAIVENIFHITITCAPDGQLAQFAEGDDRVLLLLMPEKSNDKGFAMTGSFTCMTLSALLIFDQTELKKKEVYVTAMSEMGREVICREEEIQSLLKDEYHRIVYLGSGSLSGLTREAQLKVLELTAGKIATVFDSSLGFRHGPKSFVDSKTLLFVFINNDVYTRKYDLDILTEVHRDQIAAQVVGIGQKDSAEVAGTPFLFSEEEVILPEAYQVFPDILFAQTVALNSSIKVSNTPDTPSPTGTVNRVVEGVTIYELKK
ncbi:SIS domain-containing protein [Enterococcus sp. BWB1-3]|uniref:SIS domain-containing protein n=1 Tax=unclassified Enterococcus TaxID=2608891 RepID=UPI001924A475|nr:MULTISPECIES: SIS domain-containing protein [unclassified Enterococcus]MBL1228673.1 SIS domain-containing protein [Enterococcus sp. BWB1-3]MCB5952744.1 SIS domain-containing protein [Enterococcus sp. BWT-B8]MCB5953658.1 SIS domain-containing protein [Enterococcus sp. CWB-B31]